MAFLTRKQQAQVSRAIGHLQASRDYIMGERVRVCRVGDSAPALTYVRPDGAKLSEVTREYGSDLCRIDTALQILTDFYAHNVRPLPAKGGA